MKEQPTAKATSKPYGWIHHSLALTLIFSWILTYPMHGFFLQQVFGENAHVLGHIFSLSHGLGLAAFAFLPSRASSDGRFLIAAGGAVFAATWLWTIFPESRYLHYMAGFLGISSACLVLAWTRGFMSLEKPALTIGSAMAATNVIVGLTGFAHVLPESVLKTAASMTGLAPFISALYMFRRGAAAGSHRPNRDAGKESIGPGVILSLTAFAAAAYFSGGLWYRAVTPRFYSQWPDLMGADTLIYAFAVMLLAIYAEKRSFYWVGTIALSLLGMGLAASFIGLDRPAVVAVTLFFLSMGLGATDLFYWLTLRKMANFFGSRKTFGLGLGLSLFFITAPGVALDAQLLTNPLTSPQAAVIGACLLFLINPLLVWALRPLSLEDSGRTAGNAYGQQGPDADVPGDAGRQPPEFWFSLTGSEKKIYDLICQGQTDAEIAEKLFISRHTVKFHVRNVLRKAGVSNRKELLLFISKGK